MQNCPICFENKKLKPLFGCCHLFCTDCSNQWLNQKQIKANCPICRYPDHIQQIEILYSDIDSDGDSNQEETTRKSIDINRIAIDENGDQIIFDEEEENDSDDETDDIGYEDVGRWVRPGGNIWRHEDFD